MFLHCDCHVVSTSAFQRYNDIVLTLKLDVEITSKQHGDCNVFLTSAFQCKSIYSSTLFQNRKFYVETTYKCRHWNNFIIPTLFLRRHFNVKTICKSNYNSMLLHSRGMTLLTLFQRYFSYFACWVLSKSHTSCITTYV